MMVYRLRQSNRKSKIQRRPASYKFGRSFGGHSLNSLAIVLSDTVISFNEVEGSDVVVVLEAVETAAVEVVVEAALVVTCDVNTVFFIDVSVSLAVNEI